MKNILTAVFCLVVLGVGVSCSNSDDGPETTFEQLVIADVELPASFQLGEEYRVPVTFELPDSCTEYYSITIGNPMPTLYEVVVIGSRLDNGACTQALRLQTEEITIRVNEDQVYTFRFWQGDDINGDPIFLDINVPVE